MPSLPAAALFRASHRAAVASSGVRPAAACVGRVSGGTFHRPVSARACLLSSRAHLSTSACARESSVVGTPAAVAPPVFKTLLVREVAPDVMEVRLNRPDKSNAMNRDMWAEIQAAFEWLARPDVSARAILLSGEGACCMHCGWPRAHAHCRWHACGHSRLQARTSRQAST